MKLFFKDKTKRFKSSDFESLAKRVFKKLKVNDKLLEVGLIIVDNKRIKALNKKYRGIDETTDVLSFPIDLPNRNQDNENLMLGDIIISLDKAKKYSLKDKKTIKKEVDELFKHGLLHLLGYDHKKNKKEWQKAELKIKHGL